MRFRRSISALLVAFALSVTVACNAKDAVTNGLIGLQTAAIAANSTNGSNGQPLLPDADAIKIVRYTTQALTIIKADQAGWQDAVRTGWAAFLADIPAKDKTQFAAQIAVLTAAIGAL